MPFWKKEKKQPSVESANGSSNGSNEDANGGDDKNGGGGEGPWVKDPKVNYKARLEHKQYLAQESPEPVYDLSECALKTVPSGVYSRCKVMRKEGLLLHSNELSSLSSGGTLSDMAESLQVLDLHCNQMEKLPDEIGGLRNLRVLYVHFNKIKRLPESIGGLSKLESLNLAHNNLKELPAAIGQLTRLRTMNLAKNPKLTKLVKQVGQMRSLEKLTVDAAQLVYPAASVCREGTEAIMKFMCKECDIEYISPSEYQASSKNDDDDSKSSRSSGSNGYVDPYEKLVKGNLERIEKEKEEKAKKLLALEKHREEEAAKEALLTASMNDNKKRLLTDLAEQEAMREQEVKNLQQLKDKERESLFGSLASDESQTDALITELMRSSARQKDPQKVLEDMERERREMEERFTIKAGEAEKLREQEVLKEMQRVMQEEMYREQVRRQYEEGKNSIINTAVTEGMRNDAAVDAVLQSKGKHQQDLISDLLADEKYQREAFTALFVKEDQRHREICQRVEQIQAELASLTVIEMTKKDLKVDFERDVMDEKRETLTKMLVQLMDQKEERSKELQDRLQEMERGRQEDQDNYWLIQYQKLMDSKPKGLVEAESKIDGQVKDILTSVGAEEYIPVFALRDINMKQLALMKDKDLSELGVHNTYLRQKILMSVEDSSQAELRAATKAAEIEGGGGAPTAPPSSLDPHAPSAPAAAAPTAAESKLGGGDAAAAPSAPPAAAPVVDTFKSTECVVCMENKCDIIFLPCGHVCCCFNCESGVTDCPLCRASITQKVRLR